MDDTQSTIEPKEQQINGSAVLYAAMRDVTNAWKTGFLGETELTSLILNLPDDVSDEVQEFLKTSNPAAEEQAITDLKKKYTVYVGYMKQVARFNPNDVNFLLELKALKLANVQYIYGFVVRSLSKHKYIYNEGRRVMDRGAMSLYAEMEADE